MKIVVNGASVEVVDETISHADVLRIAFDGRVTGLHTITFSGAVPPLEAGDMNPGDSVRVKDGTMFNVYAAPGVG
jgi:hypothetical protein